MFSTVPDAAGPSTPGVPVGVRVIIAYKIAKAVVQAIAAVGLWLALRAGFAEKLGHAASAFADHAVFPFEARLGRWLSGVSTPSHLHLVALLLGGDALVSAAEGWVLRRGYRWGRWLVVLATASLLPLEIYEIARRPQLPRVLVFLVNLAIVVYLAAGRRDQPLARYPARPV
jgi:uncharacterized membrane protein (DUF2068 family)